MKTNLAAFALALSGLFLSGCEEDDATSLRVRLAADLSGTIHTSALVRPAGPGAAEQATVGASFDTRVDLNGASGRFPALAGLRVADIQFGAGTPEGGLRWLRVELPGGADARWPEVFMPLSEEERSAAANALDPEGNARDLGKSFKLEIDLPTEVISNGATGKVRGTKHSSDGTKATLVVPIAAMREAKDPLVWQITW
jgi:hypothetical protein